MSGRISEELVDSLRQQADIVEIIAGYVSLRKQGQNYTGLCPFHQEKTPSFVVSPAKQIYHCFGCGKGGNVFSFLMEQEGLGFQEALEKLAVRYGVTLPSKELTPAQKQQEARTKRLRQINHWAMEIYQSALAGEAGAPGRLYFEQRGLPQDIVSRFCLGYAPDSWDYLTLRLLGKGATEQELLLLGLAIKSQKGNLVDKFRSRVMFPILDEREHVVGFGGRIIGEGQPKYLNSQETPLFHKGSGLYGLHLAKGALRQQDQVIIMEGYMDVLAAHSYGLTNTVASLGTALTVEQARLLTRYTYQAYLCYDADAAGQAAALRGIDILDQQGCQVRIIRIPEGKDPDDFLRNHGKDQFLQLVDKAFSSFEYKFANNMEKFDQETVSGKVAIIQATLPDLARIKSAVARQGYITMMADKLHFPEPAIKDELRRYFTGGKPTSGSEAGTNAKPLAQAADVAQGIVIRGLLQSPEGLAEIEEAGGEALFVHPAVRGIYQTLLALHQAGYAALQEGDLVALLDRQDEREWLTGVLLEEEFPGDGKKAFLDSLVALRRLRLDRQIKETMTKLAALEKSGDHSGAKELMAEISGLNIEKQRLNP